VGGKRTSARGLLGIGYFCALKGGILRWAVPLGAGAVAAGGDALARAVHVSHVWPTAAGALLFVLVGRAARRDPRLSPFFAGAATHAALDAAWLAFVLGVRTGAAIAALTALLDVAVDVLAASAGARTGTR
jgi:hypothetical protein